MSTDKTQIETLTASVLAQIEDRFEEGDDGEMLFTSPINDFTSFDLYPCETSGTWDIVVDDMPDGADARLTHLPSLAAAKTRVAEIIAEQIAAAQALIASARQNCLMAA